MAIEILGVRIDTFTHDQVIGVTDSFLASGVPHYMVTVNPEFLMAAERDSEFKGILNNADLAMPDGIGLLWAASFLAEPIPSSALENDRRRRWWCVRVAFVKAFIAFLFPRWIRDVIPERVAGSDLVRELVARSEGMKSRIAFVGGRRGVANRAANTLLRSYPKAHIVLADDGIELSIDSGHQLRYTKDEQRQLLLRLHGAHPDIVLVAFGQQKQEKWIVESFRHLPDTKLFIGVGGSFDFLAGEVARAPQWFRAHGIEWLWRLLVEPWRIGRIFTATVRFMVRITREKYRKGS